MLRTINLILGIVSKEKMLRFGLLSIIACLSLGHITSALMVTNLADILRSAGLNVTEVDGWKTRAHGPLTIIRSIT